MASEYAEEEAYADDADPLVTERLADAANCQEAESESSDDAPLSSCWNTPIATEEEEAVAPAAAVAAADGDATAARSPRQHPPQQRRRRLEKEQQQLQSLARQLAHQKKLNAELQQQLHAVRKNEMVAQVRACWLCGVASLCGAEIQTRLVLMAPAAREQEQGEAAPDQPAAAGKPTARAPAAPADQASGRAA